jgi:small subunit ribosomal protein S16
MAVKIRLRRTGAKHQPSYRLVVADSRSPRDGRFIETIGHYNPRQHSTEGEPELYVDPDRALYWLDQGAQPTETANSLLRRAQILKLRFDRNHGIDVSERLAGMRRKPLKEAVAVEAAPEQPAAAEGEAAE